MSQLVTINSIPRRANLVACQTGSLKDTVLNSGEYLGICTTNNLDANGQGVIDAYIVGDGERTVSALLAGMKLLSPYGVDDKPTAGSGNLITSGAVYEALNNLINKGTL